MPAGPRLYEQRHSHATPLLGTVLDQIGLDIASGAIATGQKFTLNDISARFGISRTVARETMRALEQLGMVSSSRRVGLTVLPLSEWSVFDPSVITWRLHGEKSRDEQLGSLKELRIAVEPLAARRCAQYASPEDRAEILRLAEQLCALELNPSPRAGEELSVDLQFHSMILHASGNEMFAALAPSLISLLKGKSVFGSEKKDPIAGTAALHRELAQAINSAQPDAAEALSRRILDAASAH